MNNNQEAEKGQEEGIEWCKGYEVGFKKGGKAHAVLFHKWMINDQPNLFGNDTEAMETFYDSYGKDDLALSDWYEYWVNKYRPAPATPQPVTGEWQLCPLCNGQGSVTKPAHIPGDVNQWVDSEGIHTCHICNGDKLIAKPQAASRPADAVEFAEWVRKTKTDNAISLWVRDGLYYTDSELYQLFLNSLSTKH